MRRKPEPSSARPAVSITGRRARDIVASVEAAVKSGALGPGDALPAVRILATEIGVSTNTVAAAYRQLRDRGMVGIVGRRTVIATKPDEPRVDIWWADAPVHARRLSWNLPDPALYPRLDSDRMARILARYGDMHKHRALPRTHPQLAEIGHRWFASDGMPAKQLVVSAGWLDTTRRVIDIALRRGDRIAVEDPGHDTTLRLLPTRGIHAVGVLLDDHGPRPDSLAAALNKGATAFMLTSRAQHPTGVNVSADRARELRSVLSEYPDTILIEADPGFGVTSEPPHFLAGATNRWVVTKTVDYAFGADLRVALVAGDAETIDQIDRAQSFDIEWTSYLLQEIFCDLWMSSKSIVDRAATTYARRRTALITELARHGINAVGHAGLNVWIPLPRSVDEMGIVVRLMNRGWIVAPSRPYAITSGPGLRITVADMNSAEIGPFCEALSQVLSAQSTSW